MGEKIRQPGSGRGVLFLKKLFVQKRTLFLLKRPISSLPPYPLPINPENSGTGRKEEGVSEFQHFKLKELVSLALSPSLLQQVAKSTQFRSQANQYPPLKARDDDTSGGADPGGVPPPLPARREEEER